MCLIKYTRQFKKDLKWEKKGRYSKLLDTEMLDIVAPLAQDVPLNSEI